MQVPEFIHHNPIVKRADDTHHYEVSDWYLVGDVWWLIVTNENGDRYRAPASEYVEVV